jgi:hypothetical protein
MARVRVRVRVKARVRVKIRPRVKIRARGPKDQAGNRDLKQEVFSHKQKPALMPHSVPTHLLI